MREFSERTLFLPAHQGVAAKGVDFKTTTRTSRGRSRSSSKATQTAAPVALSMPGYKWSGAIYAGRHHAASGQVVAGEITLDEAYARIPDDIKQKVAEARSD